MHHKAKLRVVPSQPSEKSSNVVLRSEVREILSLAWKVNPRLLAAVVTSSLVAAFLGGVSLLMLVPIANSVFDSTVSYSLPLVGELRLSTFPLWMLLCSFIALVGFAALCTWLTTVGTARLQQQLVDHLRHSTFESVLHAQWSFVLSFHKSDIVQTITVGAQRSGMAFQLLMSSLVAAVLGGASVVVAAIVSPLLALITVVGLALAATIRLRALRKSYQLGALFSRNNKQVHAVVTDSLNSLRLIRAHDASATWIERLSHAFTNARSTQFSTVKHNATLNASWTLSVALAAALITLFSVQLGVSGTSLAVFLLVIARLNSQAQGVVSSVGMMASALPAVRDLSELRRNAEEHREVLATEKTEREPLTILPGEELLSFHHVDFSYPGTNNGISNLSFTLLAGEITALAGPSGAGKSTVADLALGLLAPQHGHIDILGHSLTVSDLAWWRHYVAYVPQETLLIPGTLRDNLTWSVPRQVTDQECWDVLTQAAAGFVGALPEGLDTVLGDGGQRLSGGERQRIALARALLRNPQLIVLDEATSALDDATEQDILSMLRSLVPRISVLLIAHRESTLAIADRILSLAPQIDKEAGETI